MSTLEEKLKYCAVQVNNGSGCVYQPGGVRDYSYVLTVKHNISLEGGGIQQANKISVKREAKPINVLECLHHQELDIAILKVDYLGDPGFILSTGKSHNNEELRVHGYPKYLQDGIVPVATDIHCKRSLEKRAGIDFELITDQPLVTFNRSASENVTGFSGSGIFRYKGDEIILKGIFPKLNDPEAAHNKVNGFHLSPFNELLKSKSLPELIPEHLVSFQFLHDYSFKLEVSEFDEANMAPIRTQLKNRAWEIVQSDLVPAGIKKLFSQKLLVNDAVLDSIDDELLWTTWLEFLTVMNILKDQEINTSEIDSIFHEYCLKYSDSSLHWTKLLKTELANSDYRGLKIGSMVIVQTAHRPDDYRILRRGDIPSNIALTADKSKFRIDMEGSPLDHFDFVHADYLHKECIIQKLSDYENLETPNEIIQALRNEYTRLFNNEE